MLKNYLVIAVRNLSRQKGYAFINIAGLAVGMAVCLVILLYVQHELSYDRFHEKADRIYRLLLEDDGRLSESLPDPIGPELEQTFPEVEAAVRIMDPLDEVLVTAGDRQGYEDGHIQADPSFFSIFSFRPVEGNLTTALTAPGSIVLTHSFAKKYFGDESPIGKSITLDSWAAMTYTVKAVIEDVPGNSHLQFQTVAYRPKPEHKSWNYFYGPTYVLLRNGVDADAFERKLPDYARRSARANAPEGGSGRVYDESLRLQRLTNIHLQPDPNAVAAKSRPVQYLHIFSAAAVLILLIACVNYTNLATSRSLRRAREVGIRKVVGAGRAQLARQFFAESILTSLTALVFAVVLVEAFLPVFGGIIGVDLSLRSSAGLEMIGLFIGIGLLVGVVSGSYPALLLSRFQPAHVLKGNVDARGSGSTFRKILVVFQFTVSVALILATVIIQQQMEYIRTKRLNANDAQVVVIANRGGSAIPNYDAFKRALLARPGIASVTTGKVPGSISATASYTDDSTDIVERVNFMAVGHDYLQTLGLTLIAGRDFSEDRDHTIQRPIIVNEAAVAWLDLEAPVGQQIRKFSDGTVVGVVEDFHMLPMYESVDPLVIQLNDEAVRNVLVRLEASQISQGLASILEVWKTHVPDRPILYSFLDDRLDEAYRSELHLGRILGAFGAVAILVACLGLFGLTAYMAEQRTKEIGIRKVLGASVLNIVTLLSRGFIYLVLIAIAVALPLAYFGMQRWLDDFAYRTEIGPGIFILTTAMVLLIALLTVSYQAIGAATANPVKALRYE